MARTLLRRLFYLVAAGFWVLVVFLVTLRVTFPSSAVADRIRYAVYKQTDGDVLLHMDSLSPWGLGLSVENLMVFDNLHNQIGGGEPEPPTLVVALDELRARVGVLSAVRGAPELTGKVRVGAGELEFDVGGQIGRSNAALTSARLDGDGFPLSDLATLVGAEVGADGGLDVHVDVEAPEGKLDKAKGTVELGTTALTVHSWKDLPGVPVNSDFFQSMNLQLDEVDVECALDEGKGEVKGTLRGNLAAVFSLFGSTKEVGPGDVTADLSGTVYLKDDLRRSTLRLSLVVKLSDTLKEFAPQLGSLWSDGTVHYAISGQLGRPSIRNEAERSSTSGGSITRSTEPTEDRAVSPEEEAEAEAHKEERRKRREELRERLRAEGARDVARPEDERPEGEPEDDEEDEERPEGEDEDEGPDGEREEDVEEDF